MDLPLQDSFHGVGTSDALLEAIRNRADKLGRVYGHIIACRVSLELYGRHRRKGKQCSVHVELKVPGSQLAVTREHDEDMHIALNDAFDAAKRQLENFARRQRGEVKRHSA